MFLPRIALTLALGVAGVEPRAPPHLRIQSRPNRIPSYYPSGIMLTQSSASTSTSGPDGVPKTYDPRSFDHLAEEYDFVATREPRSAFFLNHLPERRQRLLDVGCGTGILAHELSRHFASVVAIDISEPMLTIARARRAAPNIVYRREDANHLALNQRFDCIVSHTAFHHLEDVSETLRALKASLEPRGRLILVDITSRWPLFPRNDYTSTAKACLKFPLNLFRHGPRSAWRIFGFYTSRHWLDHVKCDRILSRTRFREVYAAALPGATFIPLRYFMGVVWQAPDRVAT